MISVNVELSAKDASKAVERGDIIIVIDVLRCSSTIINALVNGAKGIIPVGTVKEALAFHKISSDYLLAGERGGIKPEGFDLGNSPLEFTRERINGKIIVLTTTSGTKAILESKDAKWVLIGALLNVKDVAEKAMNIALKEKTGISLVTSGKKGRFSLEDFICAGAIIESLKGHEITLSDLALAASLTFQRASRNIYETILRGEHAQSLVNLGFMRDVEFCCRINHYSITPIYRDGIIRIGQT